MGKKILLGVGVIVLVLVSTFIYWDQSSKRAIESTRAELARLGYPTSLESLPDSIPGIGAPPTVEENAAPLYELAFSQIAEIVDPDSEEPYPEYWDHTETGLLRAPEEVRQTVSDLSTVFDRLYEAAEKPRCRFDLDWAKGYEMELPHLTDLRDCVGWLAARAAIRTEDGDLDGALADIRVTIRMASALREDPHSVSQLMRSALVMEAIPPLRNGLLAHPDPIAALDSMDLQPVRGGVALALRVESVLILNLGQTPEFQARSLLRPYVLSDIAWGAGAVAEMAEMAKRPYLEVRSAMIEFEEAAHEKVGLVSAVVFPAGERCLRDEIRTDSSIELTRLGARALAHYRQHGRYPSTLDELPGTPRDPLTGRPFVLTVSDDGDLELSSERGDGYEWEITMWALPTTPPALTVDATSARRR